MRHLIFLFLLTLVPFFGHSEMGEYDVLRIIDGDTFVVGEAGGERRVRLYGIDAPELKQPYGEKAKAYLTSLIEGKTVSLEIIDADWAETYMCIVYVGIDYSIANDLLLRAGLAWNDPENNRLRPEECQLLENEARTEKLGLWSDKLPLEPWIYRQLLRERGLTAELEAKRRLSNGDDKYYVEEKLKDVVSEVIDGASFRIIDPDGNYTIVKIMGVEAPDKEQRHWHLSKNALEGLIKNKAVYIEVNGYRAVGCSGIVYVDGRDIAMTLLLDGMVWENTTFYDPFRGIYGECEAIAKVRGVGVHQPINNPTPPWTFKSAKIRK
jgi:endonuclease YncB( thermonuclease family)